jgi:hypothetical protein
MLMRNTVGAPNKSNVTLVITGLHTKAKDSKKNDTGYAARSLLTSHRYRMDSHQFVRERRIRYCPYRFQLAIPALDPQAIISGLSAIRK